MNNQLLFHSQSSLKVTTEPPKGIKANMIRLFKVKLSLYF